MRENRLAVRIQFHAAHQGLAAGVVRVTAVHITHDAAAKQRMPQVGVELDPLCLGAAIHRDAAKPIIPLVSRGAHNGVKVPSGQFGLEIFPRVFLAGVGNGDLHQDWLAGFGFELHKTTDVLAGNILGVCHQRAVRPDAKGSRLAELRHEINREWFRAALRRRHQ